MPLPYVKQAKNCCYQTTVPVLEPLQSVEIQEDSNSTFHVFPAPPVPRKDSAQKHKSYGIPFSNTTNSTLVLGGVLSPLGYGKGNRYVDGVTQASTGTL